MSSEIIPYGKQSISEDDIKEVVEVLRSGFLTQGPKVSEFEESFAVYVGSKYAVAVANGTAALHLSMLSLNLTAGQKVLTTPITFAASANSVLYAGGEVVFCDIDPLTYCLDLNRVEELLKRDSSIRGIVPVDFAGFPMNIEELRYLADRFGAWIVEDACHAPGAFFLGKGGQVHKAGSAEFSDLAVFSFHPVKHIACGEGGMITTNDKHLYEKLKQLRTHGITKDPSNMTRVDGGWYYEMQELGYNYRIPDILCALGNSQLKRAKEALLHRQKIAKRYSNAFKSLPLTLPYVPDNDQHAYHLYVIQVDKRKELYDYLAQRKIFCQVHYIPVHKQPYYIKRYGPQSFPLSEAYYDKCLSLPMYHSLSEEEQDRVIEAVTQFYE
jgi:UDP-4-amino-4,6-dideoxy-N-acetyl-beta-L-altrosamine transaminase